MEEGQQPPVPVYIGALRRLGLETDKQSGKIPVWNGPIGSLDTDAQVAQLPQSGGLTRGQFTALTAAGGIALAVAGVTQEPVRRAYSQVGRHLISTFGNLASGILYSTDLDEIALAKLEEEGNTKLKEVGDRVYQGLLKHNFDLTLPKETPPVQLTDIQPSDKPNYREVPPQKIEDYQKVEGIKILVGGLVDLYYEGLYEFESRTAPQLERDLLKDTEKLAKAISSFLAQQKNINGQQNIAVLAPNKSVEGGIVTKGQAARVILEYYLNSLPQKEKRPVSIIQNQKGDGVIGEVRGIGVPYDADLQLEAARERTKFREATAGLVNYSTLASVPFFGRLFRRGGRRSVTQPIRHGALSRRDFLKISAGTTAGIVAAGMLKFYHDTNGEVDEIIKAVDQETWKEFALRAGELFPHNQLTPMGKGAVRYLSSDGTLIGETDGIRRKRYLLKDVSEHVKSALIATEDNNFSEHSGVDFRGLCRAIKQNLSGNTEGGSTITQQLIQNVCFSQEEIRAENFDPALKLRRKLTKMLLALTYERVLLQRLGSKEAVKDHILQEFLNVAPFGPNIYGIEEAANHYFGINAKDLSLAQSSFLAGLPNWPTGFYPYKYFDEARQRQKIVLGLMKDHGKLTENPEDIWNQGITLKAQQIQQEQHTAQDFVTYVQSLVSQNIPRGTLINGAEVTTSLNLPLQRELNRIVTGYMSPDLERITGGKNKCAVVIRDKEGNILACYGNITQDRSPGSVAKLATYAAEAEQGAFPDDMVDTDPISLREPNGSRFDPTNSGDVFAQGRAKISLGEAFAVSLNRTALKIVARIGVKPVSSMLERLGFSDKVELNEESPAETFGSILTNALRVATATSVVACGGRRANSSPIKRITDVKGNVMYEGVPNRSSMQVINQDVARTIIDYGSNDANRPDIAWTPLHGKGRIFSKTGTTDLDCWTTGSTVDNDPIIVTVAVWREDGRPTIDNHANGLTVAAPLFRKVIDASAQIIKK